MSKLDLFFIGALFGAVVSAIGGQYILENQPHEFPEPDGKVIIGNEEWRWYDTRPDMVGVSPKVWVNRHGVIYEPTGVKFPEWGEALEREDDSETGSGVKETALRRGDLHDVRRQTCRCESTNRL